MSKYEEDFYGWTQEQAALLRAGQVHAVDAINLAEEIESLGNEQRFAIESHLTNLLTHLLKYRYDPAHDPRRGWRVTIRNARREIGKRAQGRLRDYPEAYLPMAYRDARADAADGTDLPLATFPEACPWPIRTVLDPDFWPEAPPAP